MKKNDPSFIPTYTLTLDSGPGSKTFNYNQTLTIDNYYNPLQVLLPYIKTDAPQISDLQCDPNGTYKYKCNITTTQGSSTTTYKACAQNTTDVNTNGSCNIITSPNNAGNYCYINDGTTNSVPSVGSTNISACQTPFYNIQNNMSYMINNIFNSSQTTTDGTTDVTINNLVGCDYMESFIKNFKNHLIFYGNKNNKCSNFKSMGYQMWGVNPNESKLTMKPYNYSNMTSVNNYPTIWKLTKTYDNTAASCYFTIQSQSTNSKPTYYLNYTDNGELFMSLVSGGFHQYFTLDNSFKEKENTSTTPKYTIYSGNIRGGNNFYISPGRDDNQELDPITNSSNVNVCTMVSMKPSWNDKFYIIGYNDDTTEKDILDAIQKFC